MLANRQGGTSNTAVPGGKVNRCLQPLCSLQPARAAHRQQNSPDKRCQTARLTSGRSIACKVRHHRNAQLSLNRQRTLLASIRPPRPSATQPKSRHRNRYGGAWRRRHLSCSAQLGTELQHPVAWAKKIRARQRQPQRARRRQTQSSQSCVDVGADRILSPNCAPVAVVRKRSRGDEIAAEADPAKQEPCHRAAAS